MTKILAFEKSKNSKKKYDVYLKDGDLITKVSFGDPRYQQYHDKLKLWSHLDHNDKNRRRLYKLRHESDRHVKYTPGWFSDQYLW